MLKKLSEAEKVLNIRDNPELKITEITEPKRAEWKTKEYEENYRELYEETPLAYFSIGLDKSIKRCNYAAEKLLGYTKKQILNMDVFDLYADTNDGKTKAKKLFQRFLAGENIQDEELQMMQKNGNVIWISLTVRPVKDNSGETIESRSMVLDISERKKAEQELINLNKLKSEILTRASHELKTPLMAIKGFSELLILKHQETTDNNELYLIEEIKKGCSRLEKLINDILKTAELKSGAVLLKKSIEDLSLLIRKSVDELKGFADSRNQIINLMIYDKLIASFDKEQIKQVLNNILTNAIKYTLPNGLIEIRSQVKGDFIIISIKDNGIGFAREDLRKLFKRFGKIERFGQGYDVVTQGSGLGLYISKKIIELHGGDVWAESEGRNNGSTFYFSLPIPTS